MDIGEAESEETKEPSLNSTYDVTVPRSVQFVVQFNQIIDNINTSCPHTTRTLEG